MYLYLYLTQASVGILGISGDLLAILVFSYKKFQRQFYTLLITIAIYDLIYLVMAIMLFALPTLFQSVTVSDINYLKASSLFYSLDKNTLCRTRSFSRYD